MPRSCSICAHDARAEIDRALVAGEPFRHIAARFHTSTGALQRHKADHRSEKTIRRFSGTSLMILDEAARVEDELYFAVRPMLAVSGGALMMLSTPYGKRGVFYEEWSGGHGWERYEVPASECPRITEEFLDEERSSLPAFIYRQEYECSFEESEDQVFTTDLIDRALTEEVKPLFGVG